MPEGGSRRILGKERGGGGADCRRHPRLRGLRSGRRASSFWTRGVVTVYEVHPVKAESARECRSWVGRSQSEPSCNFSAHLAFFASVPS
jgi:hypothetical protein